MSSKSVSVMPVEKKDPLLWDLTLIARRALRRAARADRVIGQKQQRTNRLQTVLPTRRGSITTSHDSLSLRYKEENHDPAVQAQDPFVSTEPAKLPVLQASRVLEGPVKRESRLIERKLKASPFYVSSSVPLVQQMSKPDNQEYNRRSKGAKSNVEKTGPTNWSINDLQIKYRNEQSREDAHQASLETRAFQLQMAENYVVVSAVNVPRHPLLISCHQRIATVNSFCLGRGRARCVARRFMLDVHQIWLSNLDHLEAANRGAALRHSRIDVSAILVVKSQIQSIAADYSWRFDSIPSSRLPPLDSLAAERIPTNKWHSLSEQGVVTVTLLARQHLVRGSTSYQGSVVRKFLPWHSSRAKWHISFYDPLTGMEWRGVAHEKAVLKQLKQLPYIAQCATVVIRPPPASLRLIHTQGCLLHGQGCTVATICQIRVCTPHLNDPNRITYFIFTFLSCTGRPFRIWRIQLDALDVIGQLGLSHAACTSVEWWCQQGQIHLFSSLLRRFVWKADTLALQIPYVGSSLAWNFDFKFASICAMELLAVLTPKKYEAFARVRRDATTCNWTNSLSMCVSGVQDRTLEVPGVTTVRSEPCCAPASKREVKEGEAVAILQRDDHSRLKSVLVHIVQALDCALSSPRQISWDKANLNPHDVFNLIHSNCIPAVKCSQLRSCYFVSQVTSTISQSLFILTRMMNRISFGCAAQLGNRREMSKINKRGFRLEVSCILLVPIHQLDVRVLSIAEKSATPNKGALTGRCTRRSAEFCTCNLSRPRIVEDYLYTLRKKSHQGANDPGFYTIHLQHTSFGTLSRSDLAEFHGKIQIEQERQKIQEQERHIEEKVFRGRALLAEKRGPRADSMNSEGRVGETSRDQESNIRGMSKHGKIGYTGPSATLTEGAVRTLALKLGISQLHVAESAQTCDLSAAHEERPKMRQAEDSLILKQPRSHTKDFALTPLNSTVLCLAANNASCSGSWQRLHRETKVKSNLRSVFIEARIQGAVDSIVNTASQPAVVGMVHPASEIKYEAMKFHTRTDDCILITAILEATVRSMEQQKGLKADGEMCAKDRLLAQSGRAHV
mmetsp:Transcript_25772/g.80295  ORF Transcript_25772/g.80295 Transcript_25772/m.80295 type:complete len:1072 (+) Transcript_25772:128-3343(+)